MKTWCLILLLASGLSASACGPKLPPPGVYTAEQTRIYTSEDFSQSLIALSRTTVALNQQGSLSDATTRLVRDFVLSADAVRVSYATGVGSLATVKALFADLNKNLSPDVKNNQLKSVLASVKLIVDLIPEAP